MKKLVYIIGLLVSLPFSHVWGQACCTGGNLGTGNLQSTILEPQTASLLAGIGHTRYNKLFHKQKRIYPVDRNRDLSIFSLTGAYGISKKWTVAVQIAYPLQREFSTTNSESKPLIANGIGDLSLIVHHLTLAKRKNRLTSSLGISLPTGQTKLRDKTTDVLYSTVLQPGKGTWNALFVARYERLRLYRPASSLLAQITANLPISKYQAANSFDYQPGKVLTFTTGLRERFSRKVFFDPFIYLNFKYSFEDRINDQPGLNSGGNWLSLSLGFQILFSQRTSFQLISYVPLTQSLKGIQLSESSSFELLFAYTFNTKSKSNDAK